MSTWTSKLYRFGGVWGLCAVLAGCVTTTMGQAAPRSVRVADGSLVLTAPNGFCVDQKASQGDGSFVLFGNCAALSANPSLRQPGQPVVLTAAVSAPAPVPVAKALPQMKEFFQSEAGRAALSRSGKAASVTVLGMRTEDDLLLVHLRDTAAASGPRVAAEYWRAFTGIEGRILSLSVLPLRDRPVSDANQRALILAFVRAIRAAN
ncbi:hypothetical protein [Phaeovulum sp.]|uniref:hypothetical protein n=1 Tax=Phaeovulum sp. TaxID=2934796 RepID=UPI0039E68C42